MIFFLVFGISNVIELDVLYNVICVKMKRLKIEQFCLLLGYLSKKSVYFIKMCYGD